MKVALMTVGASAASGDFAYKQKGFDKWPGDFKTCNGKFQSPIDLPAWSDKFSYETGCAVNIFSQKVKMSLTTPAGGIAGVKFGVPKSKNTAPQKEWAAGFDGHRLVQFHVHLGSEHQIQGTQFPLEVHWVHDVFSTCEEQTKQASCVSTKDRRGESCIWDSTYEECGGTEYRVLGLFIEEGAENPTLAKYIAYFKDLTQKDSKVETKETLDPYELVQNVDKTRYWSYHGGLTTPPCNEVVDWFVLKDTVTASKAQIAAFQQFTDQTGKAFDTKDTDFGNYRPPQALEGREVRFGLPITKSLYTEDQKKAWDAQKEEEKKTWEKQKVTVEVEKEVTKEVEVIPWWMWILMLVPWIMVIAIIVTYLIYKAATKGKSAELIEQAVDRRMSKTADVESGKTGEDAEL